MDDFLILSFHILVILLCILRMAFLELKKAVINLTCVKLHIKNKY